MEYYLPMYTCSHLQVGIKHNGVGAHVTQGRISQRALKYMKIKGNQH